MTRFIIPVVTLAVAIPAAAQHEHAGDVLLEVIDGVIVTSSIEEGPSGEVTYHDRRVFGSEMGEFQPGWTDEPGFDNAPGTFPFPSDVGFDITGALREWSGARFITSDLTVRVSFASSFVDSGSDFVPGFGIPVASNGEWHKHLEFELSDPQAVGIYALPLRLWSSNSSIEPSETFWLVFNNEDDELEHEEAIEYAEDFLVGGLRFEDIEIVRGGVSTFTVAGATRDNRVYLAWSFNLGETTIGGPCGSLTTVLAQPTVLGFEIADATGTATFTAGPTPNAPAGTIVHFQAVDVSGGGCATSNYATHEFE